MSGRHRAIALVAAIAALSSVHWAAAEPLAPPAGYVSPPPNPPVIGDGFHLFDKQYLLFGFNWQRPCHATSLELEVSYVPWISDGLFWGGFYAASGFQALRTSAHRPPSSEGACFKAETPDTDEDPVIYRRRGHGIRAGAGAEFGWRMLAVDAGALYNSSLVGINDARNEREDSAPPPFGLRFRLGIALADEVFTGASVKYGQKCCKSSASVTQCECSRTPVGVSVFLYYGNELYWNRGGAWDNSLLGLSLKIGWGL